jgi:hypothetical protein
MPLKLLFADRKLGAASKLAFLQLWDFAGGEPGRVVITADWLAGVCGRSPKAAWLWLGELESHDLVKLGERNERRGTITIDIYNPCPGGRSGLAGDRQTRLPIGSGENTPAIAATSSEVSASKPPRPLVPKKVEDLSYQSTNASKDSKNSVDSMSAVFGQAAAIVDELSEPAVQKERLKRRIFSVCGGVAGVAEWVAGSAANLVVYHGVPVEDLDRILGDVDAMRCAGTLRNAGSFFHSKAKQLADRHGKPWPRPR